MQNNDYKHAIQDITNLYLGGKLTYADIMDNEEIPFKFRAIVMHYMIDGIDPDTTLENHLFYIKKNSMAYMVYKKLKARFMLNVFYEDGHGKGKPGYHIDEFEIDDILDNEDLLANKDTIFLTEVRISKLKMMAITV